MHAEVAQSEVDWRVDYYSWPSIIECLFANDCFHEGNEDSVEPEESDDDPDGGSEGSGEDGDEEEPDSKKSKLDH